MRVAVIGAGISGLVAASRLADRCDLTVFEAGDRPGGHTDTHRITRGGVTYDVDTGFIVYNERTYPNFSRLLASLRIATKPTEMSFSTTCEQTGLEYNGSSLSQLYVQKRNLLSAGFHRMVLELVRFNQQSRELLLEEDDSTTLREYVARRGYSAMFVDKALIPMGAAIWSADPQAFLDFPARTFVQFFSNHGFLDLVDAPIWRVVRGGSQTYVRALTGTFEDAIQTRSLVRGVERRGDGVWVHVEQGSERHEARFDRVVIAAHSDQALAMLRAPSPGEQRVLGAIRYRDNECVLHTDTSLLPRHREAWAAWNYRIPRDAKAAPTLTYNMNILQGIDAPETFCVTLNHTSEIAPSSILKTLHYAHPVFDLAARRAQRQRAEIDGVDRIHYCGAYWGYGFHEDGVKSALTTLSNMPLASARSEPRATA